MPTRWRGSLLLKYKPLALTGSAASFSISSMFSLDFIPDKSDESLCMDTKTKTYITRREATESSNIGLGMLISESKDGQYGPIAVVGSIAEARELARCDARRRTLEQSIRRYKVWMQGHDGRYDSVVEIADPA